jgi:hypothetical protein
MPKTALAPPTSILNANVGFLFGAAGLVIALLLACFFPNPSHFQAGVFAAFTALGGAGFCTGLTGLLEIKLKAITVAGPLAVFFVLFWSITHLAAPDIVGGLDVLWNSSR